MAELETSLKRTDTGTIAPKNTSLLVGELEKILLQEMPSEDACSWDRTGMLVGNPLEVVRGVAIALDPTIPTIKAAKEAGANVLVTHHPVFLEAPDSFVPDVIQGHTPGAVVRFACEQGTSIMSFHTALDVSIGFGQICEPTDGDAEQGISLRHLSARCVSVFESLPRVWGSSDRVVNRIVTCGGSAGSLLQECLDQGVECLICGEAKYHEALDASLSGLSIIELGHDVSEFPLCALLAAQVQAAGIAQNCISMIDQKNKWYTPESSRR